MIDFENLEDEIRKEVIEEMKVSGSYRGEEFVSPIVKRIIRESNSAYALFSAASCALDYIQHSYGNKEEVIKHLKIAISKAEGTSSYSNANL